MNKITPEDLEKWLKKPSTIRDNTMTLEELASALHTKFITPLQEEIEKWKQERDEYTTCIHFDDGVGMGECKCKVASLITEPLREKAEHYDSLQRQYEGVCASLVEAGAQLTSKELEISAATSEFSVMQQIIKEDKEIIAEKEKISATYEKMFNDEWESHEKTQKELQRMREAISLFIQQAEMCDYKDTKDHELKWNRWYCELKEALSPETKPVTDTYDGDKGGMVKCPYGISSDCGCLSFCEDCKDGKIPKEK